MRDYNQCYNSSQAVAKVPDQNYFTRPFTIQPIKIGGYEKCNNRILISMALPYFTTGIRTCEGYFTE